MHLQNIALPPCAADSHRPMTDSSADSSADSKKASACIPPTTRVASRAIAVDDDTQMANLYRRLLEREGGNVVVFDSAEDAMSATQSSFPDVAFVDIGLQGAVSGLGVCRILPEKARATVFFGDG